MSRNEIEILMDSILHGHVPVGYQAHEVLSPRVSDLFQSLDEAKNYAERVYAFTVDEDSEYIGPYASIYAVYHIPMAELQAKFGRKVYNCGHDLWLVLDIYNKLILGEYKDGTAILKKPLLVLYPECRSS